MTITVKRWHLAVLGGAALLVAALAVSNKLNEKSMFYTLAIGDPRPDIHIVDYRSKVTDNLFRESYYWRLSHDPAACAAWLADLHASTNVDYPQGALEEVQRVFPKALDSSAVEAVLRLGQVGGRTHILILMKGRASSFYTIRTI